MFEINDRKPQVRELQDITAFAIYSDGEKGEFPAVTRNTDKLYISDEVLTENKLGGGKNVIKLRNVNDGTLRVNHSSKCDWIQRSGKGGSRLKTDRAFHVLQAAPLNFRGDGAVYLQGSPQALFGRVKIICGKRQKSAGQY